MSDIEKTMELEINPYDRLVEKQEHAAADTGYTDPVKVSLSGDMRQALPENDYINTTAAVQQLKPVEIIPVSDKAVFSKINSKEFGMQHSTEIDIEEDLLVPDTEPDMDAILNVDSHITSISFQKGENNGNLRGEISLEILYRSADVYNDKLIAIKGSIPFKREWNEVVNENARVEVSGSIKKIEYRIVNERKYRVKIYMNIIAQEIIDCERNMFEGIQDDELELLKEDACIMSMAFTKTKESELNENLVLGNEKVKPLKVLKSSFTVAENHRQLTADKLVVNETIWVRVLYAAELASHGNLSNQPMLFTGKIDNTQFIPFDGGSNIKACRTGSDVSGLTAEINEEINGFVISGSVNTRAEFFEAVEYEMVTDFYSCNDDMACDNKEESVCCGLETKIAEQTIRESMNFQTEPAEAVRVVYMDATVQDVMLEESSNYSEIKGKLHTEILTMTEGNQSSLVKKISEFSVPADIPSGDGNICGMNVFVREMSADIPGNDQLNVVIQIQAVIDICKEGTVRSINNPCILREEGGSKSYPLVVCTVRQGDDLWDIAKRYRVPADHIKKINNIDTVSEGMKIVVAK